MAIVLRVSEESPYACGMVDPMPVSRWVGRTRRWGRWPGEATVCHAYECRFSQVCPEASPRPRHLPKQRCVNYWPERLRPPPHLSDLVLDLLATYRRRGLGLSQAVRELVDRLRPDGPLRRVSVSVRHRAVGRRTSSKEVALFPLASGAGARRGSLFGGGGRWPVA